MASIAHTAHCDSEFDGDLGQQLGPLHCRGVGGDLVGTGAQHATGIVGRADPPADGERDEHFLGDSADHLDGRVTLIARRRDVEEHELVGALGVVAGGELDGVAGIAQIDELSALDNPPAGDIEARHDSGHVHDVRSPIAASASATVKRPS